MDVMGRKDVPQGLKSLHESSVWKGMASGGLCRPSGTRL
jgi:hypothetical protein